MKPVYINSASCISAQDTLNENFFDEMSADLSSNMVFAKQPSYKEYIAPAMLRRMSRVVKIGTVAAQKAMEEADVKMPDAIIVGSGMGCTEDSEKFLRNVIQNDEDFLTPTNFIQSTHNTVAGQIALGLGCHAYNFTYVNSGSALEFSILDAKLQLEFEEASNILVGGADETADRTAELYQLANIIKRKEDCPVNFLQSETKGVFWGEGVAFFVLSSDKTENSYAKVGDIKIINTLEVDEIQNEAIEFLRKNNLESKDVDAVVLGFSGDAESDKFCLKLQTIFEKNQQLYYKHLSGGCNTSSSFAIFMACHILKKQRIPEVMKINHIEQKDINNLLIYNNFLGKDHSFTLLKKV